MDQVRANLNSNRDEILQNTFTRGLPKEEHFEVVREFKDDMFRGWTQGAMSDDVGRRVLPLLLALLRETRITSNRNLHGSRRP